MVRVMIGRIRLTTWRILPCLLGAALVAYFVAIRLFVPGRITYRDNVIFILAGSVLGSGFGIVLVGALLRRWWGSVGPYVRVAFGSGGGGAGLLLFLVLWTLLGPSVRGGPRSRPEPPYAPEDARLAADALARSSERMQLPDEQAKAIRDDLAAAIALARETTAEPDKLKRQLAEGRLDEVVRTILAERNRSGEATLSRQAALAALAADDTALAASTLDQYLREKPEDLDALELRWRLALLRRRPRRAAEALEALAGLTDEMDDRAAAGDVAQYRGEVALHRGEPEDAERYFRTAFRHAKARVDRPRVAAAQVGIGRAYLAMDEPDAAERTLHKALLLGQSRNVKTVVSDACAALGDVSMHRVRIPEAKKRYGRALGVERSLERPVRLIRRLLAKAKADAVTADLDAAGGAAAEALKLADRLDRGEDAAEAHMLLGQIAERRSQGDAAGRHYKVAQSAFERLEMPHREAAACEGLGSAAVMRQDVAAARKHWRRALELFEQAGAADARRLRTLLDRLD